MLIKIIQCHVPPDQREAFSHGQSVWQTLANHAGFLGQLGGWSTDHQGLAVIIGRWSDRAAYDTFMHDIHDDLFEQGGQQDAYESIDVTLWQSVLDIPGGPSTATEDVHTVDAIRLARCRVKPARHAHFIDAQRTIWNPGMAACNGMLGGALAAHVDRKDEFLVGTYWSSVAAHAQYQNEQFPVLQGKAKPDCDCMSITGWMVPIEPAWRVFPEAS